MTFPRVNGSGPISPLLAVVGEAPGETEEELLEVLVGPTGMETDSFLRRAGSALSECYKTNVSKWRPPGNDFKNLPETGHDLTECYKILREELEEFKAQGGNCILTLGEQALRAVALREGILKWRGSILVSPFNGLKVIPTIHPAALHHRKPDGSAGLPYYYKGVIALDFKRAVEESQYKEYKPPLRNLEIGKSPSALLRFLNQYRDVKRWAGDIEVIHGIPTMISLAPSAKHAMSVPLFNHFDWTGDKALPDYVLGQLWEILSNFLERNQNFEWIGQNWKFDLEKIQRILGFLMQSHIYLDTALAHHVLQPELPKNLAFLTSIYTREPYYKDDLLEFNPKIHKSEQIHIYNARDSAVDYEVAERLEEELREKGYWEFYQQIPNRLHEIYLDMDREGFREDKDKRLAVYQKYERWAKENLAALESILGWPCNVRSPKDVPKALEQMKFPTRDNAKEETLVQLYLNHAKSTEQKATLGHILQTRRILRTISTEILSPSDFDGRIRTVINIAGTETSRTSNNKLEPPIRPVKKAIGWAFNVITKHGDVGPDIREIAIADEGYEIFNVDLSQAEARILAHLCNDEFTLNLFKTTDKDKSAGDFHDITAQRVLKIPHIVASGDERFIIKEVRYGCSYGMEKRRMKDRINTRAYKYRVPVQISEYRAGQLLESFHSFTPLIKKYYHPTIQDLLAANNRVLINAYGRPRQFLGRWGEDLFREAYPQIPSSTVHDKIATVLINVHGTHDKPGRAPWIRFVVDAHDALAGLWPIDRRDEAIKIMREEMESPIDFSKCSIPRGELIIPCDVEIGQDYKNLKKVPRG